MWIFSWVMSFFPSVSYVNVVYLSFSCYL